MSDYTMNGLTIETGDAHTIIAPNEHFNTIRVGLFDRLSRDSGNTCNPNLIIISALRTVYVSKFICAIAARRRA